MFEGLHANGGLAGQDLEAIARGIRQMVADDACVASRVRQVQYLGNQLPKVGVPIVRPVGGHAVFLDARAGLPHVAHDEFPAQALAAAIYLDRACAA